MLKKNFRLFPKKYAGEIFIEVFLKKSWK